MWEDYKRYIVGLPFGSDQRQPENKLNIRNVVLMPTTSQPSLGFSSHAQGSALAIKGSKESSAYTEETIHVPSAFVV